MKFLVTHPLPSGMKRGDVEKLMKTAQTDPEVRGYRSFLNLTEGRGVCVFEAPDRARLTSWLTKNKMTYDTITEVELEAYRSEWVEKEAIHKVA